MADRRVALRLRMWFRGEPGDERIPGGGPRDFVERLTRGDHLTMAERRLVMTRYAAWATWDLNGESPFSFVRFNRADEVRACLGLSLRDQGQPLLAFEYSRAADVELFRPTVADAALFPYWSPPPDGEDRYGLTKTWPPDTPISGLPVFGPVPQPEALHQPVSLDHLSLPVRELL